MAINHLPTIFASTVSATSTTPLSHVGYAIDRLPPTFTCSYAVHSWIYP